MPPSRQVPEARRGRRGQCVGNLQAATLADLAATAGFVSRRALAALNVLAALQPRCTAPSVRSYCCYFAVHALEECNS